MKMIVPDENGIPAPAGTPKATAAWAIGEFAARPACLIYCHPRDYEAIAGTVIGPRVTTLPHGGPQPGSVWFEEV